jgi:hypothetical protein
MTNKLNLDNNLCLGDIIGDTKRIVIALTKLAERVPDDSYARWVAICVKENHLHPYVVWDVYARPNGFHAENGIYCSNIRQAIEAYERRGGCDSK